MKLIRELLEGKSKQPGMFVDDFEISGPDEEGFFTAKIIDYESKSVPEKNALQGVILRALALLLIRDNNDVDVFTINKESITSVRQVADHEMRGFIVKPKSMFSSLYQGDNKKLNARMNTLTPTQVAKAKRVIKAALWTSSQ